MSDQASEQSVQERMESLLGDGFLEAEEPQDDEPEVIEDSTEEATEDATEEESQDEPPPVAKLKLNRNGEEIEVDIEEAKNLAQMGYDYTQKTQKLAEERKQVEIQTQAVKAQESALRQQAELQHAFIKEIGKVESINEQISQFEAVDWNALSDNDPVQAQKLYIQYQQLQNKRAQTINEIQQKQGQLQQQRDVMDQTRLAEARAELLQAFPHWNADLAKDLRDTAGSYGFSEQEISYVTDPRQVRILADAAAYRKLQANKGTVTNKVQGKPAVVKPGTKDTQSASRSRNTEARQQLRKTGDQNLAVKLIEAML